MTTTKNLTFVFSTLLALTLAATSASGGELRGRIRSADGAPAVIWVDGLTGAASQSQDTVITHIRGGRFEPAVSIGFVGSQFVFRNEDNTLHNTHLYLELAHQKEISGRPLRNGATVYNIALPTAGMEVKRPIRPYHQFRKDTGYITVRCNPHPEEEAFVLVFDHPYAAVSDSGGSFTITGVPAGSHELWVWQSGSKSKWGSVDIKGSGATDVTIDLANLSGTGE